MASKWRKGWNVSTKGCSQEFQTLKIICKLLYRRVINLPKPYQTKNISILYWRLLPRANLTVLELVASPVPVWVPGLIKIKNSILNQSLGIGKHFNGPSICHPITIVKICCHYAFLLQNRRSNWMCYMWTLSIGQPWLSLWKQDIDFNCCTGMFLWQQLLWR